MQEAHHGGKHGRLFVWGTDGLHERYPQEQTPVARWATLRLTMRLVNTGNVRNNFSGLIRRSLDVSEVWL